MFIRYFYSKLIFNWVSVARENKVIEMVEIADGLLPKGYPFRMDNSSFKERKCFFLHADELYIYQRWEFYLDFDNSCKNTNKKLNHFFCIIMQIGYRYCMDNFSYSIQDRKGFFLQINCSYIGDVNITWIFISDKHEKSK